MAARGLGGLGGGCGMGASAGAAGCIAGCGAAVGTGFGVGALAGNRAGIGFDNRVLGVVEWRFGGRAGSFPFPLDTDGVGI